MTFFATNISNISDVLNREGNPWAKVQNINTFIPNIITLALTIAVLAFVIVLLIGGIRWITSSGEKEGLSNAQKQISAAIIGLVVVFSTWAIFSLVRHFFGFTKTSTPAGTTSTARNCYEKCRETKCQGFASFCYGDCRCQCNGDTSKPDIDRMWYLDNPWCDGDNPKPQIYCKNGTWTPDPNGKVSGIDLPCSGD